MNIVTRVILALGILILGACQTIDTPMKKLVTAQTAYTETVLAATALARQGLLSDQAIVKFDDARKILRVTLDVAERMIREDEPGASAYIEQAFAAALQFQAVWSEIKAGSAGVKPSSWHGPPVLRPALAYGQEA